MQTRLTFQEADEIELDAKLPSSTNDVRKVGYKCKEGGKRTKIAYKKPISKTLSRISALYEVAASVYVRLSLSRAAEARLIYNNGKLAGIASIELPGFKPMKKIMDYGDVDIDLTTDPDVETLLNKNATELLTCALCDKTWDLNTDNIHIVAGLLDFGQYFYNITHHFEKRGIITGIEYQPLTATTITADRIRALPDAKERNHWPTHVPNTLNLQKTFKSKHAFNALAGKTIAEYQKYYYLLKKLLAYDKTLLANRLFRYLGDEPLGLAELSPGITDQLTKLFTQRLFFKDGIELTFVEHVSLFFEKEHNELATVVVHMPEFRQFLTDNPEAILEIKKWFIEQNATEDKLSAEGKQSPDDSGLRFKYDLDYIDKEYNKIYRNSFANPISKHLNHLAHLIKKINPDVIKSYYFVDAEEEATDPSKKEPQDLTKSFLMIAELPQTKQIHEQKTKERKVEMNTAADNESLIQLLSYLQNITIDYFEIPNPTFEQNHSYIRQAKIQLREKYKELQGLSKDDKQLFHMFISQFELTLQAFWIKYIGEPIQLSESFFLIPEEKNEINKKTQNTDTIGPPIIPQSSSLTSQPKPLKSLESPELAQLLAQFTSSWILTLDHERINALITQSLTEYKPYGSDNALGYLNLRAYSSTRSEEIIQLQKNHKSIKLLQEIINQKRNYYWKSEPGWEESSFNTKLIKNLCLDMLQHYNQYSNNAGELIQKNLSNRGYQIEQIRTQVTLQSFHWSTIAKKIGQQINWLELIEKEAALSKNVMESNISGNE